MECNGLPSDMPKYKRGNDTIALPFDLRAEFKAFLLVNIRTNEKPSNYNSFESEDVKELVIKFPFFIPKNSMNINVWNGHVFSYFSVGGKTVYHIRVEGPNVLLEFQFDTDRYLFEDFDMGKLSKMAGRMSTKIAVIKNGCDQK